MARKAAKESRFPSESQSEEEFQEVDSTKENGQGELPEMPASSPVGKAGRLYLRVKGEMEDAVTEFKERKGKASAALIEEMKKIGKESVVVDGYQLSYRHEELDKIAVKAPKSSD